MEKNINFSLGLDTFSQGEREGEFEGILVNYNHSNLAHGMWKFKKGSMKDNEGKTLFVLYNHENKDVPVGTMTGVEKSDGFYVTAKLSLEKDEGGYINKAAANIYNLMKSGAKFELSTGGTIQEYTEKRENERTFYEITKFDAYEGSITPRGAVKGSKVTKVFNENENIGDDGMPGITEERFKELLGEFGKNMQNAATDEEVKALPGKFADLEKGFKELKDGIGFSKEDLENKFNDFNDVIKGLKGNFKATPEQVTRADEFMAVIKVLGEGNKNFNIDENTELKTFASTGTTTDPKTATAVKSQYLLGILKKLQEANPLLAKLKFINITENSLELDKEEVGLPEVAWVGETDVRSETDINALKDVDIKLHQIYTLPKLSNKLIATNYVGYVDFLLSRVEYAWSLKLANTMLNGTGTKQPLGILQDTNVNKTVEWDSTLTDEQLADMIMDTFNNTRDEISSKSDWIMRRTTWSRLAKIKDKDGRYKISDLKDGSSRTLMTRPVIIVDSENCGLEDFDSATAGKPVAIFGDIENGMLGIQNTKLVMNIKDQVTSKGFTLYYMEKLLGFGVVLPENFTKIVKK